MGITIDTSAPEGNIFSALATAARAMRQIGKTSAAIEQMRAAVMGADNYKAACDAITKATDGLVTFSDQRDRE